ncbi:MAG TPA: hypothetical protein VJM33_08540 [Microthrixaceae bacterium]|nr:hypothetical protein [Microthrixaceae bacterium]
MGRGGESAGKRRVKARRIDQKAVKTERRQERQAGGSAAEVDENELMAGFHRINEQRAAGEITEEDYERQRHEIFVALGLEEPDPTELTETNDNSEEREL